jgi:hypothetical protein
MIEDFEVFKSCRICFEENGELISPCNCKGTLQYVHPKCLSKWRTSAYSVVSPTYTTCPQCKCDYTVKCPKPADDEHCWYIAGGIYVFLVMILTYAIGMYLEKPQKSLWNVFAIAIDILFAVA